VNALDRTQPPAREAAKPVRFPPFERTQLDSGLTVYTARSERTPLMSVQVLLPAGAENDPSHRPGLAAFTADLLEEGTRTRSSTQIADEVESLGGSLATAAGWSTASIAISLLSVHADQGLDLLEDVATRPAFDDLEIERLRRERLTDLLRRRDQSAALAVAALVRSIYGNSGYGHSLVGGEASVRALARDEIVDFYDRHKTPRAIKVIAVGNLPSDDIADRLREAFGGSSAREAPDREEIRPRDLTGIEVVIVDRTDAAQTEIRLGHAGVEKNHPDRPALTVLNSLLGGKFTSRINLNLRERHGFTYGANSSFSQRRGPGPFVVSTAVATDKAGAAVQEVLSELSRLQEEAVPEDELVETLSYLGGVFAYGLQTNAGILQHLQTLAVFDLPDDHFEVFRKQVAAVTVSEIRAAAQRHLHPDRIVVVAVGPAAELKPQLEGLGEARIVEPPSIFA